MQLSIIAEFDELRGRRQGQARARRQRYHLMVRQKLRLRPEEEAQRAMSTSLSAIAPLRLVIVLGGKRVQPTAPRRG